MLKHLHFKTILLLCALVVGSGNVWGETATLSNAEIVAAGDAASGYTIYAITGGGGKTWNVNAIKNYHSNKTNDKFYLQIKKYTSGTAYYIQVPEYGTKITSITMTVSSTSKAMDGGENSSTLYFSSSNSTSAAGTGVASGTGASSVTIDCSSLDLNTGYITASGAVRIWDVQVTYSNAAATKVSNPTINGTQYFLSSTEVTITCGTDGAAIQYSTDGGWQDYTSALNITETTTITAKATKAGLTDSDETTQTFTKKSLMSVAQARAAIDAASGTDNVFVQGIVCDGGSDLSSGSLSYWISDDGTETNEFEIYKGKGLNGANFSSNSDVKVGDIVVVYGNITKYNSTYEFSAGSQLISHIKKVETPAFSLSAGAVVLNSEVAITCATDGATIYYTLDGTDPTTSSSVYSAPITVDAAKTIKAFAVKDGCPNSEIATAAYTIAEPVATPTFSVAAGTYNEVKSVTISTTTEGASIYYTTDGTEPTTSSTLYSEAISVDEDMTVKAIAIKDGMADSEVASAEYTIVPVVTLPFSFDNGKTALESTWGLTQSGLGSDYNSSPKLKLDDSGDYVILRTNQVPGTLSFDIKGNSFSGGTFTVQTSTDGTNYTDLASYTTLGDTQTEEFNNLAADVRYIKWIYTNKSSGNVGLGNINVKAGIQVAISDAEYVTFSNIHAVDFSSTAMTVYTAAINDSKTAVTLTEVASKKVPANTAVILNGEKGTYTGTLIETADALGNNDLLVSDGTVKGSANTYVLAKDATKGVGFYVLSSEVTIPAGKAYLQTVAGAPEFLSFVFDSQTTGINKVNGSETMVNGYYNLAGQRVAKPTKGLYIVNGKKVVIK